MNTNDWIAIVNKELKHLYGIEIDDSGFTQKEFLARYGDLDPIEAALTFGDDYDLSRSFW